MTLSQLSTRLIRSVYYRIFLNQCYICSHQGEGTLCHSCSEHLPRNNIHCERCARPSQTELTLCGECQLSPPSFTKVIAPLRYQGFCRTLIHKAKFYRQSHFLRPLAKQLAEDIRAHYDTIPNYWSFVPTSDRSIKQRGYCQTTLLMKLLRKELQETLTKPVYIIEIRRTQDVPPQHTRSKKERHKLTQKMFECHPLPSEHVILIDDIVTTGSTIEACAKTLMLAGANTVSVWAIARTPE